MDKQEDSSCTQPCSTFSSVPRLSMTPGTRTYLYWPRESQQMFATHNWIFFKTDWITNVGSKYSPLKMWLFKFCKAHQPNCLYSVNHEDKYSSLPRMTCNNGHRTDSNWNNCIRKNKPVHYDMYLFVITVNQCNQQILCLEKFCNLLQYLLVACYNMFWLDIKDAHLDPKVLYMKQLNSIRIIFRRKLSCSSF